jgi:hypothetical protein
MTTKLYIAKDGKWHELPVYNRVEADGRLDEQLDSGTIQTINRNNTAYEDYSLYRLLTADADGGSKEDSYFGFDTVEQRVEDYYIHTIELVEPTRIVMGISIDGCKVTQPIEGEKKSLYDVVFDLNSGFLSKAKLISTDNPYYTFLEYASEVVEKMKSIPSPEFHWECGTLLWECLCDLGNVINCIPRVRFVGTNTKRMFIDFVPVNDITAEYEL